MRHGFTYLLEGVVIVKRETAGVLWVAEEPVVDDVGEGFGEPFSVESFELTSNTHGRSPVCIGCELKRFH